MTNEEKLKANMAAARLLGMNPVRLDEGAARVMHCPEPGKLTRLPFNLFINAADCLEGCESIA